jgi:AraC-like DNA-binding protein
VYKSPRDIVILTQIQKATELLKKTDKTVEEIATACGFSSVNYFMGRFFHEYKLTPREYRAEHASRGL